MRVLLGLVVFIGAVFFVLALVGNSDEREEIDEKGDVIESAQWSPSSQAIEEYRQSINEIFMLNVDSMNIILPIIKATPHIEYWLEVEKGVVIVSMAIIQVSYETAKEITPPRGYEEIHKQVLLALGKQSKAMGLLASALDQKSKTLIIRAQQLIEESRQALLAADALMPGGF